MTQKTDEASEEANNLPMTAVQLCGRDPLAKLFLKVSGRSSFRITLIAFALYGVIGFGATVLMPLLSAFASYLMDVYLR